MRGLRPDEFTMLKEDHARKVARGQRIRRRYNMPFEEVKSEFVTLEVGQVLEGTLAAIKEGRFGDDYEITKSDGTQVVLGSKSSLGNRITQSMVGKRLRITRLEDEVSKKGRTYHNFKVEIDK